MKFRGSFLVLSLVTSGLLMSCRQSKSKAKEFEFSSNICADIQKATDDRWSPSKGVSKAAYYSQFVSQESSIIDYEIPRYQKRLSEMKSGTGPANGPTSAPAVPLDSAPDRSTPDDPANRQREPQVAEPGQFYDTSGIALSLEGSERSSSVSSAQGVCPGCDVATVESRLATLQRNKQAIGQCAFVDRAAPANSGSATNPDAGLSEQEKANRKIMVREIGNTIQSASNINMLCSWWGDVVVGGDKNFCVSGGVTQACTLAIAEAKTVVTGAINSQTSGEMGASAARPAAQAVVRAMQSCIQQIALDRAKKVAADAGTAILKDAAASGAKEVASEAAQKAAKIAELKKAIALQLCKSGANALAAAFDEKPQINYDNSCAAIFQAKRSRAKACISTTASVCSIAAGDVKVENFLSKEMAAKIDQTPLAALVAESSNAILSVTCQAGGKVTSAACGAISQAAAQIREAIYTGNNDWAHCVGTDQMGACGGTVFTEYMLGVKASDMKEPVREPVPAGDAPGKVIRDVCFCSYSCYQDDWGTDTELTRSNFYSVIARGSAGERECANHDGRWNWTGGKSGDGHHLYWKKHQCEILQARMSANAGTADTGGFEILVDGRWVYKNASSGSGYCPSGI